MATPLDDHPEDACADLTPVTVRCLVCNQEWEEFKAVADHLFTHEATPATSSHYVADSNNCVFCNPTPGEAWRNSPYL